MKKAFLLIVIFWTTLKVGSAQTFQFYDVSLVGSLIDKDAIFPQESGLEYGLMFRGALELSKSHQIQIDGSYSRLESGLDAYLFAIRNNFRSSKWMWSSSLGYIYLDPFRSYFGALDYEFFANDLLTITTGLLYEIKNLYENQYAYDFSFQIYFTEQLMLRSGIAFTGEKITRPLFELIVGFEYLPKAVPISFFFELGNELVLQNQFGLRYHFGHPDSLKKRHRSINGSTRFL